MSNNPWKTLSSKYMYENPWLKVRHDEVIQPSNKPGIYGVIEGRNFAVAIPKIEDKFYMVEQYRYPVSRKSIEFPMGGLEDKEDIETGLKRELEEEAGLVDGTIKKLGFAYASNVYSTIGFYVYVVEDCKISQRHLEGSESDMTTKHFTLDEIKG